MTINLLKTKGNMGKCPLFLIDKIYIAVTMFLAGISLAGCFASSGGIEKWQEEVQLSDGRIIVIERETLRVGGGGSLTHRVGSRPKEHLLRFTHPDKPEVKVEWRSVKMDDQFGTNPEFPLILDMETGHPIVFTLVGVKKGGCANLKLTSKAG